MKIVIHEGTSFFISDEFGDTFGKESGLYFQDTRFLKKYKLFIDKRNPIVLSSRNTAHFGSTHYLTNLKTSGMERNSISIKRSRFVGEGLHEDIDITNHLDKPVEFELSLELGSGFEDIFEVKQQKTKRREVKEEVKKRENKIIYSYKAPKFLRKTVISFRKSNDNPHLEDNRAVFKVRIEPKKTWHTCIEISTSLTEKVKRPIYSCEVDIVKKTEIDKEVENYLKKAPYLETDYHYFERAYARAKRDLAALALRVSTNKGSTLITAAGIPWFVTLFGRDSIIAGLQSLILTPAFAKGALQALADRQGTAVNDFTYEKPGAIVHEVRFGELAVLREVPHALYYATIDATPLFLMLVGEYFKWTGDLKLIRKLEPNIKAALEWIDNYGDMDSDGYIEYPDKSISWKDSFDGIVHDSGKIAKPPIAVAEAQAYVYAAKMSIAGIYNHLGKPGRSLELKKQAAGLKRRFNIDFWMDDKKYFALALDADKKQVDVISSNAGHLLWSGIVDKNKARSIAKGLMDEHMFSGWGIRTITKDSAAYNPISYHRGSVWPHDNAIIAAGLKKYGFRKESGRIIEALIQASRHFAFNRLPELFCGYDRSEFSFPVDYPTSSSPQAWAASTIPFFITTILGIEPNAHDGKVIIDPTMIKGMDYLGMHGIAIGKNKINVHVKKRDSKIYTDVQIVKGKLDLEVRQ